MKATIKNFDNKLFALDESSKYRRVIHKYVFVKLNVGTKHHTKQPLGVVCAVIDEKENVCYGYSQVSLVDKYNKKVGLQIAVGRSLTDHTQLYGPDDFEELSDSERVQKEIVSCLYDIYNSVEKLISKRKVGFYSDN